MGVYDKPMSYLDRAKMAAYEDTFDSFWDRAEELAGDRIEAVRRSRIQWTYLKLELHPDAAAGEAFFADCRDRGIRWNEWNVTAKVTDFAKKPSRWAPIPWLPDTDED